MTEQETVAPPSGKRTEVSAPDRRNAATAVELVEPVDLEVVADRPLGHPPTPRQWQALSGLARTVGKGRALEVGRYWLTEGNAEDAFGSVLDQLGTEASHKRKGRKSPNAYLDDNDENPEAA